MVEFLELFGELQKGKQKTGQRLLCFKDARKRDLKAFSIPTGKCLGVLSKDIAREHFGDKPVNTVTVRHVSDFIMDPRDKDALRRQFVLLTDDLDTPPICDYLIQENVITLDDVEKLKDKCKKDRNRDFITMLKQKGPLAFGKFMTILKTTQPHLRDAILKTSRHLDLPNPDPIQPAPVLNADQLAVQRLAKLRDATWHMEMFLDAENIKAAIVRMIPQGLKDKADAIREMGGAVSVDREIENNKAVLQQSQRILNEVDIFLHKERTTDEKYRGRYREQWQMLPLDRIVQPLEIEAEEYHKTTAYHLNVVTSVEAEYNRLRLSIERLSLSDSDLEKWLYSCSDPRQQKKLSQLRRLLNQWETLQSERSKLEHELVESHSTDGRNLHQAWSKDIEKRVSQSTESQKRIITEMKREKEANRGTGWKRKEDGEPNELLHQNLE
ncbi:hypothetical protein CAPTEDRAFT_211455 [Capitella teleta]|uniref:CARD domain-containing protein n=1 Tax=Capitella teleta TaxID=283909 RepID=R7U494_CAPTE|nr:hypothetical protein CAPTEDRAFT_211455 [Capitella teleta]|eukprot:ELT97990.1 hypothetical protein CAPTEDRAFT_211455 [Capitella teleta]